MAELQALLLLAGIVDPKHRLTRLVSPGDGRATDDTDLPRVLSPFDEAALETALRLRGATPGLRITALVTGGPETDGLARGVAALRPDRVLRLDCPPQFLWDPAVLTQRFTAIVAELGITPDLVLIGREFGDCDDGLLPPFLAEACGFAFAGLADRVTWDDGRFVAQRVRGAGDEAVHLPPPALVSVTNSKANRLRQPLLKNVILAKRDPVSVLPAPAGPGAGAGGGAVRLTATTLATPPSRGNGTCRMLTGDAATQAAELARALMAAKEARR